MKKSVGFLLIAVLAFSIIQFSFTVAESGSSDDDGSVEIEASAEASSDSESSSVEASSETKVESRDRVGEVKREIKREIRDGKIVEKIKEKVKNESGEFEAEMEREIRFEAGAEREKAIFEFEAKLRSHNGTIMIDKLKIKASNLSDDEKEIIAGKINARTGLNLTAEDIGNGTALRAVLSNGRFAEIKILPDTAAQVAVEKMRAKCEDRNCTVELKEVSVGENKTRAVYRVETEKEARTLWIFKTKMKVSADVDSETGDVIKVAKPWWAFLASEKDEIESEIENATNETEVEANASADITSTVLAGENVTANESTLAAI